MNITNKNDHDKSKLSLLHDFLSTAHEGAQPMSLTKAHGFLCAVISAPIMMMPSQWQPLLFDGAPNFESLEQANQVIDALMSLYNTTINQLQKIDSFQFVLWDGNDIARLEQSSDTLIADWCEGYLEVTRLDHLWRNDEEAIAILFPLGVLANQMNIVGEKDHEGNVIDSDEKYKKWYTSDLKETIEGIYYYWEDDRKNPININAAENSPYKRQQKKIGRNEPCICGSGMKFKNAA